MCKRRPSTHTVRLDALLRAKVVGRRDGRVVRDLLALSVGTREKRRSGRIISRADPFTRQTPSERTRNATLTGGPALMPPAVVELDEAAYSMLALPPPVRFDDVLFPPILLIERASESGSLGVRTPAALGVLKPLMAGSPSFGRWWCVRMTGSFVAGSTADGGTVQWQRKCSPAQRQLRQLSGD